MNNRITIGIPSKGRLKDKAISFFEGNGLKILQSDKEPSQTEQLIGIAGLFLISTITVVEANLAFKKAFKIVSMQKEETKAPIKKGWFK